LNSRFPARLLIALVGAWRHFTHPHRACRPTDPQRILIAHQLLLGDAIMMTPLIAKLRRNHPDAAISMLIPPAYAPLYAGRPYGVSALPFDPRSLDSVAALLRAGPFDLALLPTESRLSWLARAMGARWIAAFDGEPGRYKNFPIDEFRPFAAQPKAWGELAAELADGSAPPPYRKADWPAPPCRDFALPDGAYVLLHVGASTPLKQWHPDNWRGLADWLTAQGRHVVWSCGRGEEKLIDTADPDQRYPRYAGNLDLAQLWRLLAHARLVVCPDTGVTHLAHLAGTPSVVLYSSGNPALFGRGEFWREHPEEVVFSANFPCRNENLIFRRQLKWGEHCGRTFRPAPNLGENPTATQNPTNKICAHPGCMDIIGLPTVIEAVAALLARTDGGAAGAVTPG